MAKAYLLVSVFTLLVGLVYGQEAFPEQELQDKSDRLVEVAEDLLEEEQNSNIDLLLLGSATSRADCKQKKKCRNKGGTCQKKGDICVGKSVKGCAKGCSCCLPEEIICKRSKKCKKANGACITRGKCYGKIIAKGCRKPKICKKTHVCCVQDGSTTEVPTCRGPRCPVLVDCPNDIFTERHVCLLCNANIPNISPARQAQQFVTGLDPQPVDNNHLVFFPRDYSGDDISYVFSDGNCVIQNPVMTYSCDREGTIWRCNDRLPIRRLRGFCTAESSFDNGVYVPGSLECPCPNPILKRKHICSYCRTKAQALTFTKENRPNDRGPNTVLAGQRLGEPAFVYEKIDTDPNDVICKITYPESVMAWQVTKHNNEWDEAQTLGNCNNLQSALSSGHLFYDRMKCYKEYSEKKWGDGCITLQTIEINETPAYCMERCTQEVNGCNAFNYKFGEFCILMTCWIPFPDPVPNTDYDAYYNFEVPTAAESNIVEE